jgi:uncharacterized protein (TIGR03067 family)
MNRFVIPFGLLMALATALWVSPVAAEQPEDLKLLAGKWKPVEANLGDNKIDQLVLDSATIEYAADKYTLTIGEKTESGSLVLDEKKVPKCMDIFPTTGDNNGKTFLCVYELEGDTLKICYSLTPSVRPENFEPDSNTLLFVRFERVKE